MELQEVRDASKFDYTVKVDKDIETENVLIPPMLAQPFIENAIEHWIRHKETSGHTEITDLKNTSGQGCGTRVEFGIPVVLR